MIFYDKRNFSYGNVMRAPADKIGIYRFWRSNKIIYVGETTLQTLKVRLKNHLYNCHNELLKNWIKSSFTLQFDFCIMYDKKEIKLMEDKLIKQLQPDCNKKGINL